jgi:outer membrane receptor protein involved in Fe transport
MRGPDGPVCGGSTASAQGRFISFDPSWNFVGDYVLDLSTGHTFKPFEEEHFNFGPYNHMQRPDRKWSGGAFARYTVNPHFEPYAEIMFMDDSTDAEIAPTASWGAEVINCDNPMLSPQQRELLCTQAGFGPNDYANVITYRRNVEGGPRTSQLRHTSIRFLGGLRGDISPGWSYDVYGLHAQVSSPRSFINDFDVDHIGYAMDVVGDPSDPSTWRCRSGDPGCVPWNIFQAGGVTREAIDYMSVVALTAYGTRTQMVNLTVRGDLEGYGVAFPSASEGVQLALGAEYREERLSFIPDEVTQRGAAGFGGGVPGVDGSFNVRELFVEALVPLVQDTRGAEDLTLELGYRYADYDLSGGNSSYKGLLSWAPIGSLKLRAGFNRAVRAPNVVELFVPETRAAGGTDICTNDYATGIPAATLEECLRTGVSASQYGSLPGNSSNFMNALWGGNTDLKVEVADTLTVGLVWTPEAITGLSTTIDYYDIALEDTIGKLSAADIVRQCAQTGDPRLCGLVHRDSAGSLWLHDGYVDERKQNIGRSGARGVDLSASYPLNLGGRGFINFSFLGTYMLEKSLDNGVVDYDCVGLVGNQCWQPHTRWRHRVRASWQTSFNTTISLGWRFVSSVLNEAASDDPHLAADPDEVELWKINGAYELPTYNFFDLAATYSFREGLRLTLGVNNILDKDPQIAPELYANDNGTGFYGMYDPLGRTIYTNLQFEF